ncbi:MAG: hypothetical protein GWP14_05210 [Actinobacteria bacterium]|nr:hypothetical protein [Actinomycetota bacterium]
MRSFFNFKVIVGIVVSAAVVAGAVWYHNYPVHHFGTVVEGVLYRSAQPDEDEWKTLHTRYGIKTVFDLRGNKPNEPWAITERRFCQQNGIAYIKMPVGPTRLTDAQLQQFIEAGADPSRQPILVHCEHGKARTGVLVAAYRIVAQGWSYTSAMADFKQYKDHIKPGYAAYLRELTSGHGWRPARDKQGRIVRTDMGIIPSIAISYRGGVNGAGIDN